MPKGVIGAGCDHVLNHGRVTSPIWKNRRFPHSALQLRNASWERGQRRNPTHLGNHIAVPWMHVKLPLLSGSLPPRVKASAEVLLSPWAQSQLAVHGGGVSQGQGKWGRATHHLALLIVLGSMARAAELVGSLVPGHDAAKVSAHGQECEVLDVVRSGDEVVRLTLQSLHQLAVVVLVALHPRIKGHRIAINISCKLSTTATT